MKVARRTITLAVAIGPLATIGVFAQDYAIDWYTMDGGGETFSTGGSYELSGTIGQPDAGYMTGGEFELAGGFWPVSACFIPGDLDHDGDVDLADLSTLLAHYNQTDVSYEDGDIDGDNDVDLADLSELLAHYGDTCP